MAILDGTRRTSRRLLLLVTTLAVFTSCHAVAGAASNEIPVQAAATPGDAAAATVGAAATQPTPAPDTRHVPQDTTTPAAIADPVPTDAADGHLTELERDILDYVHDALHHDHYDIVTGVSIEKLGANNGSDTGQNTTLDSGRSGKSFQQLVMDSYHGFARTHTVNVKIPKVARLFKSGNSFMTGFGLGFLAFGLKKLLLPVFIGAQIVKSVLIAMFLPSILGGLGKLVGKGLSSFAGASGSSNQQHLDDFDFKDPAMGQHGGAGDNGNFMDYAAAGDSSYGYPQQTMTKMQTAMAVSGLQQAMNRYSAGANKVSYLPQQSENYYVQKPFRQSQNFKVFHKIPSSSMLLTSYDPFYSPLLSRLDAIFKQMGIGHQSEKCRERMVCLMYANPAKYAPYSNLISAQLSRELNELRKPTSDNPDILRFFKYMKAAKDGQDGGADCPLHLGCPELMSAKASPAMLTTYNEINKLVLARNLK